MLRKILSVVTTFVAFVAASVPARAYSLSYPNDNLVVAHHWVAHPIIVSVSTSLLSPALNIKTGSDIIGALHRAFQSWSNAADIQFVETTSTVQTVSPADAGDGVSLITISAENASFFAGTESPGRTRVFYDSGGAIVEADIALNPKELFSTDGTPGTYDLESTFAHEIGHLLGLEHSAIIGATMQPRQAKNGTYGLPAFTQRSLSEDDYAGARALYDSQTNMPSISGRLVTNTSGRARTIFGAQIFAEDVGTGKLVAGSISLPTGDYRLSGLRPGVYRVFGQSLNGAIEPADIAASGGSFSALRETKPFFRSFVASFSSPSGSVNISSSSAVKLSLFIFSEAPALTPRVIGMNGELSTVPLPLEAGSISTIYVGGEGLDQVSADDISISSPLIKVDTSTVELQNFGTDYPVISFQITVPANVQPGDYTIRLRSTTGELAYLPGALTIEAR